jgi:ribosomal protein S18 acetylase RimI-like enzyme
VPSPIIRPARADEYDEVARVWMDSWVSTGLDRARDSLLASLRARVTLEIEKGWSLFVADDGGTLAAMLALHLPRRYLDQLFVAPKYQGQAIGRQLLAFTRTHMPDEISLRCARENEKAWRWYERQGFIFEKEEMEPKIGLVMDITDGPEKDSANAETLLVASFALVFGAVAHGRDRAAL